MHTNRITELLDNDDVSEPPLVVSERFAYETYGKISQIVITVDQALTKNAAWTFPFQGARHNPDAEADDFRNRDFKGALGRWLEKDQLAYVEGVNHYPTVSAADTNNDDKSVLVQPELENECRCRYRE